tara:strand:+ start:395 stop:1369 length:975 start_codon:yes stop_codon:yes gene_type:complete
VDEFDLIERLMAPLADHPGAQGLKDDGAVLEVSPGHRLAMTKDMMAEDVHFLAADSPDLIARKLLRTNLSDLAAMGARPIGYLVGMALDAGRDEAWLAGFVDGLRQDQSSYGISLLGGDTIANPQGRLTLSLTLFGECPEGTTLARSGANVGDLIAVSGTIGDAALGLQVIRGELVPFNASHAEALACRYRLPQPRLDLGQGLLGLAHAALDISDGLIADAKHLADASSLALILEASRVPLSAAASDLLDKNESLLATVLSGGDDYELLFSFDPANERQVRAVARRAGVDITIIGHCEAGRSVRVSGRDGETISVLDAGWRYIT